MLLSFRNIGSQFGQCYATGPLGKDFIQLRRLLLALQKNDSVFPLSEFRLGDVMVKKVCKKIHFPKIWPLPIFSSFSILSFSATTDDEAWAEYVTGSEDETMTEDEEPVTSSKPEPGPPEPSRMPSMSPLGTPVRTKEF